MIDERWHITTVMDRGGNIEVEFRRLGARYLARVDVGRLDGTFEETLRNGVQIPDGWEVRIPENWRGRPGSQTDGIRFLEIRSPRGKRVVLDFWRGLAPHNLGRAYEAAQERKVRTMKGNYDKGPWPSGEKIEKSRGEVKDCTKKKSGLGYQKVDQSGKGTK